MSKIEIKQIRSLLMLQKKTKIKTFILKNVPFSISFSITSEQYEAKIKGSTTKLSMMLIS